MIKHVAILGCILHVLTKIYFCCADLRSAKDKHQFNVPAPIRISTYVTIFHSNLIGLSLRSLLQYTNFLPNRLDLTKIILCLCLVEQRIETHEANRDHSNVTYIWILHSPFSLWLLIFGLNCILVCRFAAQKILGTHIK